MKNEDGENEMLVVVVMVVGHSFFQTPRESNLYPLLLSSADGVAPPPTRK